MFNDDYRAWIAKVQVSRARRKMFKGFLQGEASAVAIVVGGGFRADTFNFEKVILRSQLEAQIAEIISSRSISPDAAARKEIVDAQNS